MTHNIPNDLKYTKDHEWAKIEGDVVTVGITDFAQSALGDIVFVELPEVGRNLNSHQTFGVVESIKSVSDLFSPLSGTVVESNSDLINGPEQCNQSPYSSAWMIKLKISNPIELNSLMSANDYEKYLTSL
jgi:glycine cleavage system H protein